MPYSPCGCRCGCIVCSAGGAGVLQSNMTVANDACISTPGCASLDGDKVMVKGTANTGWAYVPDVLPFDETKICYWAYDDENIVCDCDGCPTCSCFGTFDDEGIVCDPDVGPFCTDAGASVNSNADCTTCGNGGCTVDCNLTGGSPKCTCVSDGMGGYVCSCDDSCTCDIDDATMTASRKLWVYLSEDETEVVFYTEVLLGPMVLTGYTTFAATDGQIDCTGLTATITLTVENPGAQGLCTPPTSITYEFI